VQAPALGMVPAHQTAGEAGHGADRAFEGDPEARVVPGHGALLSLAGHAPDGAAGVALGKGDAEQPGTNGEAVARGE